MARSPESTQAAELGFRPGGDARSGPPPAPAVVKSGDYLAVWLEDVARPKLRPRTFENYESVTRIHLVPGLGGKRLDRLTPADVRQFLRSKADGGLAPGTVKKLHVVLGSALQAAVRDDLLARNVARLVEVPVPSGSPVRPHDVEEARAFLQVASTDRLYALWAVAIALGLRRGEAAGLRWEDVDLDGRSLRVEQTLQRTKDGLVFAPPKTERSRRTIPLPSVCVDALKAHQVRQDAERAALGPAWTETGLVFTTTVGTQIEPRNISRAFEQLCGRSGLRRIRFHDLRHTCATLLLAQDVPARVVMEILGHSQIAVTMNTYTHVVPELQREAAKRMDRTFADPVAVRKAVKDSKNKKSGKKKGPQKRP